MSELDDFEYTTGVVGSKKTVNIKWTILNFKRLLDLKNEKSPSIGVSDYGADIDEDLKFNIVMELSGLQGDLTEICFRPRNHVYLRSKLLINHKGNSTTLTETDYTWRSSCEEYLLHSLLTRSIYPYLNNDCLILELKFSVETKPDNQDYKIKLSPSTFKSDMENLLITSNLSDVLIRAVGGEELPAHKYMLAARSTVFRGLFQNNFNETSTNVINSQFEKNVISEMLQYIYMDSAPNLDGIAAEMLKAADYYDLDRLKTLSERELAKKLATENAIEILELADKYSAANLKHVTVRFIKANIEAITGTKDFKALQSTTLLKDILAINM